MVAFVARDTDGGDKKPPAHLRPLLGNVRAQPNADKLHFGGASELIICINRQLCTKLERKFASNSNLRAIHLLPLGDDQCCRCQLELRARARNQVQHKQRKQERKKSP